MVINTSTNFWNLPTALATNLRSVWSVYNRPGVAAHSYWMLYSK